MDGDFELGEKSVCDWGMHYYARIGALVRLVREAIREADKVVLYEGDLGDPEAEAWLSEARALVGEGEAGE